MSAFDTQVSGNHYSKLAIQPMQYSMANKLDACQHTIIKYVTRFRDKGGLADLQKARHVLDMLIELEYGSKSENAEKPAELGDGWIQWNGGECPVPAGTMVRVRYRNGKEHEGPALHSWCTYEEQWRFGIASDLTPPCGYDIIAYRIISPTA